MTSIVTEDLNGIRADLFIKNILALQVTRKTIQNAIVSGKLKINNTVILKPSYKIPSGSTVSFRLEHGTNISNDIPKNEKKTQADTNNYNFKLDELDIIFEDDDCAVINKPNGLIVHDGVGETKQPTLVDLLKRNYGEENLSDARGEKCLGIVHRLDKNTSGLMLIAKNNNAHVMLTEQIRSKSCTRKYLALCHGVFVPACGRMEDNIIPDPNNYKRYITTNSDGKLATAIYKTISVGINGLFSLVELSLETGRTHQIRLQCNKRNHPIVGDSVYTTKRIIKTKQQDILLEIKKLFNKGRQMLHSTKIEFTTPSGKRISLAQHPPADMMSMLELTKCIIKSDSY